MSSEAKEPRKGIFARIGDWFKHLWRGTEETDASELRDRDPLEDRREALREANIVLDGRNEKGAMGIAFSGGGIRSATLSLGITQALVEKERLLDFDYCSGVSGGGYFASFLTSLFLPDWARGPNATPHPPQAEPAGPHESVEQATAREARAALLAKKEIAFDALCAKARSVNLKDPGGVKIGTIRNPIWWLREHSRYLAPNGTSDYLTAAVYMVRNWLAMIYVMALPIAIIASLLLAFDSLFIRASWLPEAVASFGKAVYSPVWTIVLLFAFLSVTSGCAYWSTDAMSNKSDAPKNAGGIRGYFLRWVTPATAMIGFSFAGLFLAPAFLLLIAPPTKWLGLYLDFVSQPPLNKAMAIGCLLFFLASLTGFIVANSVGGSFRGNAYIAEVRRRITVLNATLVTIMLVAAAFALVDTLSIWAYHSLRSMSDGKSTFGVVSALWASLLPVFAFVINKAQQWSKEKDSFLSRFLSRSIWRIALIVGITMFLLLGVGVHMLVQSLVFGGEKWIADGGELGRSFFIVFAVLAILTVITGSSTGFINLSSLHGIYAARLTRAFLGAANMNRLRKAANVPEHGKADSGQEEEGDVERAEKFDATVKPDISITDSDPNDQIPVHVYQQTRHLGPLHLINVTLNETRSQEGSQLLERDRKGVPLIFAPEGILVNAARERRAYKAAEAIGWRALQAAKVEKLSVGQLCAISGAAASTAMGSQTTLGGSLAFSFANIRLGYWWNAKGLFRQVPRLRNRPGAWLYQRSTRPLRTYFYLWNELISNYTRQNARLNLSDGGHFDNSGAYELLRRQVKAIVVCDNGADPDYRFGDLEVLVRKARIDLGLSVEVADPETVRKIMGDRAVPLFLNGDARDWRARAGARCEQSGPSSPDDMAHCLLLEVFNDSKLISRILWLKPRLSAELPQDVIGYALEQKDFPHETTADQFFNEAQWESYRALGYTMMRAVLGGKMGDSGALLKLIPREPPKRGVTPRRRP